MTAAIPAATRARLEAHLAYAKMLAEADARGPIFRRAVEAALGRADLFYLMVYLLRRPDVDHDWLFARCREIERARDGYLDLWAREHGKSSLITFGLTIQDILRDPEITVGIFSHTRPIAKGFLHQIKTEFETNDVLKQVYPDVLFLSPTRESPRWSEDGGIVVKRTGNPKEATVEAWGLVDGQPTGKHFRLRIYDDVVTRESVTTPEQIEKTTKAWELSDNLGIQADRGGAFRMIGTRYSLYDTYATIIERGAASPRFYPATHNGRLDGEPVFFSPEEWQRRLKTQSRQTVAAQLLQNPMADDEAVFRPEWLRSWEVRPKTLNVYIMADPSRGRSATSDNTAIAVVGVAAGGTRFLLDGACHRMTLSQRWQTLRNLYRKWSRQPGVQHIAVGYERYGAQSDDEYFAEQMQRERFHFPIAELNWTRDNTESKRERVERLEPDFRNGRFFLPLPVWREGRPCVWRVGTDPEGKDFGQIMYSPTTGLTRAQMAAMESSQGHLIAKALKNVDSEGKIYDLTVHFIQEYTDFPFGRFKDLIDSVSRLYDLDAKPPAVISQASTEPPIYDDGV